MPRRLEKSPLTATDIDLFRDFYCGDEPWEREVSDFIHGMPGGVLEDLAHGNQMWYYYTREDKAGFTEFHKRYTDPDTGVVYEGMLLNL